MAHTLLECDDNETPGYSLNKSIKISDKLVIEWYDVEITSEITKNQFNKSDEIKIEENQHSAKDIVDEKKIEHKYLHTRAKEYVASDSKSWKLFPQMNDDTPSVVGATGIICAFAMYTVPYGVHSAYTFYRNRSENWKFINKKIHNANVTLFNTQLNQLKQLENKLKQKKIELTQQEEKLNNFEFKVERNDPWSKVIVCIGPTGYGKSLVCNRLLGNKQSIDELEESKNALYNVAEDGETESETKQLSKHFKKVFIKNAQKSFILSVVDTPGAFDSFEGDVQFKNQMAEYFRASGGVNMFCIFFKFRDKINKNYKDLLGMYTNFWGKDFWKHCVIVITNCDKNDRKLKKSLPKTVNSIKQFLNSMNVMNDVPIYEFGDENYAMSTSKLLLSLTNDKNECIEKYKCDQIMSPIDKLYDEIKPIFEEYGLLTNKLDGLSKKILKSADKIK